MTYFYRLLAFLMPTASVDRAVAFLTKAAAMLQAAEDAQNKHAEFLNSQIASLEAERVDALNEAARAKRVAQKIAELSA